MEFEEIRRGRGPFRRCVMTHVRQSTTSKHMRHEDREITALKVLDYLHREIHQAGSSARDNRWLREFGHSISHSHHGSLDHIVPIVVIVEIENVKLIPQKEENYITGLKKESKKSKKSKINLKLLLP
jgi:hypothetical protein